eukprot:gene12635-10838_t
MIHLVRLPPVEADDVCEALRQAVRRHAHSSRAFRGRQPPAMWTPGDWEAGFAGVQGTQQSAITQALSALEDMQRRGECVCVDAKGVLTARALPLPRPADPLEVDSGPGYGGGPPGPASSGAGPSPVITSAAVSCEGGPLP